MIRKSFRLSLMFFFSLLLIQIPASFAYQTDSVNHIITVAPGADPATTTSELGKAFAFLTARPDKATRWICKLNPGKYYLTRQISSVGLQNVGITSSDLNNPAKLIKVPTWDSATSAEYLIYLRMAKMVNILGIEFYGLTNFATNANPVWPDQGLYLGSSNTVRVDRNKFFNFGNAALRVDTNERDPKPGVNSFNTTVVGNTFNNFYQLSTTTTDQVHGGTDTYLLQGNTFYNVRGSIKFASRTSGAKNIKILDNKINGGDHFGLEINNYNNFNIEGNTIENIKEVAINMYTGDVHENFDWGDNFTVSNNTIKNVGRAIRYSHESFSTGYQYVPHNVTIENNMISGVSEKLSYIPAISVTNGLVDGIKINNNQFYSIANKKYIGVLTGCLNLTTIGNQVEGTAYGSQIITALK